MNIYVLTNRKTGLLAAHDCMGQHDGRFCDDVALAKEFGTYGECAEFGQNFDDNWQPEALFDERPYSASFAPGARCSTLDEHPFSGSIGAGDY
ncbi:MAG: hypothetical protein WA975_18060 [Mesorhizobium sp.]